MTFRKVGFTTAYKCCLFVQVGTLGLSYINIFLCFYVFHDSYRNSICLEHALQDTIVDWCAYNGTQYIGSSIVAAIRGIKTSLYCFMVDL